MEGAALSAAKGKSESSEATQEKRVSVSETRGLYYGGESVYSLPKRYRGKYKRCGSPSWRPVPTPLLRMQDMVETLACLESVCCVEKESALSRLS